MNICFFFSFACVMLVTKVIAQPCVDYDGYPGQCTEQSTCLQQGRVFDTYTTSCGNGRVCCVDTFPCSLGGSCLGVSFCRSKGGAPRPGLCIGPVDVIQCCIGSSQGSPYGNMPPNYGNPPPYGKTPTYGQPPPTYQPPQPSGGECMVNGQVGSCSTACTTGNWFIAPNCVGVGNGCCLGAPDFGAPPPVDTPPATPPSNSGGCSVNGQSGTCSTTCTTAEFYIHDNCGQVPNGCCLGSTGPPPTQPFNTPPSMSDQGTTRANADVREEFRSQCFVPSVAATYLGKSTPAMVFSMTVYVQRRLLTQTLRQTIQRAISSGNQLFSASGFGFGDVKFLELPRHLDADQANIGNHDLYVSPTGPLATYTKSRHANEAVSVFVDANSIRNAQLLGALYSGFPYENSPNAAYPHVIMTVQRGNPGFSDLVYHHELGHAFGLFHTFQTFQGDSCSDVAWSGDVIPDTSETPLVEGMSEADKCNVFRRVPCEGQSRQMDTVNRMSYGDCSVGGGFAPLTRHQFGRMRCAIERHMSQLRRAGSRSRLSPPRNGFVATVEDTFETPSVVDLGDYVVQIGDTAAIKLPLALVTVELFLYPTSSLEMPPKTVASAYRVLGSAPGPDMLPTVLLGTFANGEPVDRGDYILIAHGRDTTGAFHTVTTTVFTIDVNSCPGNTFQPYGVMRTLRTCHELGGTVNTGGETVGDLVCCLAPAVVSDIVHAPLGRETDANLAEERKRQKYGSIYWFGYTSFWGAPMIVTTIDLPKTEKKDFYVLTAGQIETTLEGVQKLDQFPDEGSIKVTPKIAVPGAFTFGSKDAFSTRSFDVVPLPCRSSNGNDAGYCLPTRAITSHIATTPTDLLCSTQDFAPCAKLDGIDGVQFACCSGRHEYSDVQASAAYLETAEQVPTGASATVRIAVTIAAVAVAAWW